MPDVSTQTDLSLFDAREFKRGEAIAPIEGKPVAAPPREKSLGYKREAIAHVEGKATGPPSAGMLQWLGKNTTRANIASELDIVPVEELERLRKHPYLHWRPPQANVQN
ncbi:hypothetical protein C8F04DRAFT_1264931 [Mycena alexandri]|uniref:Uncharacterized protein n=1 Tax=Mycena alexandri TaxID=1745969 RepID=A0AAD6SL44_9AGAR|nr:hypothetical protein C8F04DRAFT_1264931 [Mycena alexandri]